MITAALGSILCQHGKRVLLFDASPWQSLAFHFGASEARTGRRTFYAPGSKVAAIHLLSCEEEEKPFLGLDEWTASSPVDYVLFDLSGVSGERLMAYLRKCDRIIVPLLPDLSALRIVATMRQLLEPLGSDAPSLCFLLNGMDSSAGAEEVRAQLTDLLGDQLFPSVILQQPEVRKALAEGIVLPSFAPESQATGVFGQIVDWLLKPNEALTVSAQRWSEG